MDCNDCIHKGVCFYGESINNIESVVAQEGCNDFDSKTNYIEKKCNIGDTVWVVGTKCLSGLYEHECEEINEFLNGDICETCPLDHEYIVFPRKVSDSMFCYIHGISTHDYLKWGKTIFSDENIAKTYLAKLQKDNNTK